MTKERVVSVVCLCVAIWPPVAQAQTAGWNPIGPERGTAFVIAVDPQNPSTVFAGTKGGVFKSTDGGSEWFPTNLGLPTPESFPENGGPNINALAVHPQDGSTLYAGPTFISFFGEPVGRGVFASRDGGAGWHAANAGIESLSLLSLAIDRPTPTTLYLVGRVSTNTPQVYASTDGGSTWAVANVGMGTNAALSLSIDPTTSSTLYAGTGSGVFKSIDGGASWTASSAGCRRARSRPSRSIGTYRHTSLPPPLERAFSRAATEAQLGRR